MCGRYSQAADMAKLAKRFGIELAAVIELSPRYNLAPSDPAPTILLENGKKRLHMMKWGITRQWGKDKPPVFVINLRAEKLAAGPFKNLLPKNRCLIPADGFYEWKAEGKKKFPYRFTMNDDGLFAMPAIFDESPARAFCIFTVEANPLVAPVHHRMPAILPKEREDAWLDPKLTDIPKVISLLQPYPTDKMKSWPVSTLLNSAKYDDPDLIRPLPE